MRIASASLLLLALAACGNGVQSATQEKDANRITADIARQAKAITAQAENGAAAVERALENEGAAIFENRAALLNEAAEPEKAETGGAAGTSKQRR